MLLNELPDDCLLTIFNLINSLDDLFHLSKVCSRWNQLIQYRLRNIKFVLGTVKTDDPTATVYLKNEALIEELNVLECLPNLKILEITKQHNPLSTTQHVQKFTRSIDSIVGLIYPKQKGIESVASKFENIEAIVTDEMDTHFQDESARKLKQIYLRNGNYNSLKSIAHNLVNLVRLHIYDANWETGFYEGPKFENLKILELMSMTNSESNSAFTGFHFMRFCPSLQSALLVSDTYNHFLDVSSTNDKLRDLVIEHDFRYSYDDTEFIDLFAKFPNLENLAIRGCGEISELVLMKLVNLCPKMKLLDFRDCPTVTSRLADYLSDYCRRSGRSIVIYYHCEGDEPEDWPKIDASHEQIVEGFDFMAHCFFRRFFNLPLILDGS